MIRVEFTSQLYKLWQEKHYEYLKKCFMEKQSYIEGSFESVSIEKKIIVVNATPYNQESIKKIIINYYCNDTEKYHSCVGDVVYMFLTDLIEAYVDILKEIANSEVFVVGAKISTGYLRAFRKCKSGVMEEGIIIEVEQQKVLVDFLYYEAQEPKWIEKSQCFKIEKRLLNQAQTGMIVYYVEEKPTAEIVEAKIIGRTDYHFKLKALDGRRAVQRADSELYLLTKLYNETTS
jgi:hypothetical protein